MGKASNRLGKNTIRDETESRASIRNSNTPSTFESVPSANQSKVTSPNANLKNTGGSLFGKFALGPAQTLKIIANKLVIDSDLTLGTIHATTPVNVIPLTGTTSDLENITGGIYDMELLLLIGTAGNTITIKHNFGGNGTILCPGNVDYVLASDEMVLLVQTDKTATSTVWRVLGNSGSAGSLVSPLTTKGDIWGHDTVGDARIPGGATDGHVLTYDSTTALGVKWAAVGSGSGFLLTDLSNLDVANAASENINLNGRELDNFFKLNGVETGQVITSLVGTGLRYQSPSGQNHSFEINGTPELTITDSVSTFGGDIDLNSHELDNFFKLNGIEPGQVITSLVTGLRLQVPAADNYVFEIDGTPELTITDAVSTFGGDIDLNAHELDNWFKLNGVGTNHVFTSVDAVGITYNIGSSDSHVFQTGGTPRLTVSSAGVDVHNNIVSDISSLDFNRANVAITAVSGIELGVNAPDTYQLKFDGTPKYTFSTNQLNLLGQDVDNAGVITLDEQSVIPTGVVNEVQLYAKEDAGVTKLFYKDSADVEIGPLGSGSGGVQDKIEELNTSVEVIDSGTDGTIVFTTDGVIRGSISNTFYTFDLPLTVNQIATFNGGIDGGSEKIVDVADPTDLQDVATKNYVDTEIAGVGTPDKIEELDTSVEVIDSGTNGTIVFTTDNIIRGSIGNSSWVMNLPFIQNGTSTFNDTIDAAGNEINDVDIITFDPISTVPSGEFGIAANSGIFAFHAPSSARFDWIEQGVPKMVFWEPVAASGERRLEIIDNVSAGIRLEETNGTNRIADIIIDETSLEITSPLLTELKIGATTKFSVGASEIDANVPLNMNGLDITSIGAGTITNLTEETTPAAGDFLLGVESGGNVRKFDVGDLPGGGGGVTFPIEPSVTDNSDTWTGTQTLNLSTGDGHVYKWTVDQNLTFAGTVSNVPSSGTQRTFELEFVHDGVGGTFTVTLPTSPSFVDEDGATLTSFTIASGNRALLACRVNEGSSGDIIVLQKNVAAAAGVTTHSLLDSTTHTDTSTGTVARGDIIVGNSTPAWSRLAKGTADQVLAMDGTGTDIVWTTIATGSQTPWTSNIDGDGHNLFDFGELEPRGITKPVSLNRNLIYSHDLTNDELVLNVNTDGEIRFDDNGTEFAKFGKSTSTLQNTLGYALEFLRDDGAGADDEEVGRIVFQGNNDAVTPLTTNLAMIKAINHDATNASENGQLIMNMRINGTNRDAFTFGSKTQSLAEPTFEMYHDEASSTGDVGIVRFYGNNDAGSPEKILYAEIQAEIDDDTDGSEDGAIKLGVANGGPIETVIEINANSGSTQMGFFDATPIPQPSITGSTAAQKVDSLILALDAMGIIVDNTT